MAGVLDLPESEPPKAAMLLDCLMAAVTHSVRTAKRSMFGKLPTVARMAVGRFFPFLLAGCLDDAGYEKPHLPMQAWFVRQWRFR
uniref:hypothetical protein n=1 Tax=Laribacter hongkongensis TaxID=168471 RepID=UPI0015E84E11|nr:hypothetical protein [Laribacter hongkongensis]